MPTAMMQKAIKGLSKKLWPHYYQNLWSYMKLASSTALLSSFPAGPYQNRFTYCKTARLYSTLRQSVVHDLCADIDVDKMRADCSTTAKCDHRLADVVEAEVQQRLDNAVKDFSNGELRLLKILQLEHSFLFSEGYAIPPPESLTSRNWLEAMTMTTMEERLLYYCNLERIANKSQVKPPQNKKNGQCGHEEEGENCSSIFGSYLSSEQEERLANYRLASAMVHGDVLVVDMGFDENHLSTEIDPLVSQLWDLYLVNRDHPEPLHLVFTNCNFTGPTYRHLLLSCMVQASFVMATFTEQNHTDMFPKQDLVYLSAQSKEVLPVLNTNKVYILGAYYDPMVRKKLSYVKAQEEKLKCVKLPIDHHVKWAHQAHKDLDLDDMVRLLLSVRSHGQWKRAFVSEVPHLVNQNAM